MLTDDELDRLVDDFVAAARLARGRRASSSSTSSIATATSATSCSARAAAPGRYGGSLENRTRFLRQVVDGIRARCPGCAIGVRLSAFDTVPFGRARRRRRRAGDSADGRRTALGFGFARRRDEHLDARARRRARAAAHARAARRPLDLRDRRQPVLQSARAAAGAVSAARRLPAAGGSAARRRAADSTRPRCSSAAFPRLVFVGSAYSYLQEWLPHVAQHAVRARHDRFRRPRPDGAVVSGPAGRRARRPRRCGASAICRTFSDCTTGPRIGLVSGCYPARSVLFGAARRRFR